MRTNELYTHTKEQCSLDCKKRGCGRVASIDGNWKLTYKICLWIPTKGYPDDENLLNHLPNVCSQSPVFRSAFCKVHKAIIESLGYPSDLRKFVDSCGADSNSFTKEGRKLVRSVLERISKNYTGASSTQSGDEAAGIKYLLRDRNFVTAANFEMTQAADERCKKETGALYNRVTIHNL